MGVIFLCGFSEAYPAQEPPGSFDAVPTADNAGKCVIRTKERSVTPCRINRRYGRFAAEGA